MASVPVVVALYKGREFGPATSVGIAWWQRSIYSHCELLLGRRANSDLLCASSTLTDGGVRVLQEQLDPLAWDCFVIPDRSVDYVRAWFDLHRGERYDLVGWLGFIFRRIKGLGRGWWCSEACAAALGWADPWRFDVATFAAVVRLVGRPIAMQEAFNNSEGGHIG